jgi:hypothetical protein
MLRNLDEDTAGKKQELKAKLEAADSALAVGEKRLVF